MINSVLKKIFGSKSDRDMKKMRPLVEQINAREIEFQSLSDEELKAKTEQQDFEHAIANILTENHA